MTRFVTATCFSVLGDVAKPLPECERCNPIGIFLAGRAENGDDAVPSARARGRGNDGAAEARPAAQRGPEPVVAATVRSGYALSASPLPAQSQPPRYGSGGGFAAEAGQRTSQYPRPSSTIVLRRAACGDRRWPSSVKCVSSQATRITTSSRFASTLRRWRISSNNSELTLRTYVRQCPRILAAARQSVRRARTRLLLAQLGVQPLNPEINPSPPKRTLSGPGLNRTAPPGELR